MTSRKIAILLTSNDTSEFARRFPNDGLKVESLLRPLRPDWRFEIWPVKDGVFPPHLDAADGYVITGSPASVHDPLDWIANLLDFIRGLDAARKPLVGLCFGHQAIARALGGQVVRNPGGWRLGTAPTRFTVRTGFMEPAVTDMTLYAAHNEQVSILPQTATLLGGDAFCPVGAFSVGSHIFATEYHPEFTRDFVAGLVEELDGKLPDSVVATARKQLDQSVDGKTFAQWMVRFFEQSPS